jgi:hypothetical protein
MELSIGTNAAVEKRAESLGASTGGPQLVILRIIVN